MKKLIVNPVGLKGREIHERQLALMGMSPINENENKKSSAVELTKIGPDGNAYAIIRENHEYYIKKTQKTTGLVLEDFNYIGGLQNKKQEAYPSYAKAIKHLNLKFKSLAEAYGNGGDINVFEDDNLLSERAFGMGFSNEGNMEGMKEMWTNEEETVDEYDEKAMQNFINQYGEEKGKQIYYATANKEDRNPETFEKTEGMVSLGDDVELTEYEKAIDEMMSRYDEELHGGQHELDVNKNGKIDADDLKKVRGGALGENFEPHGHYTVSNHGGYEIMLSPDGEMAKVRDAFGSDNPETSDWLDIEYVDGEDGEMEPVIDPNGYNIPLNMVMKVNEMSDRNKELAAKRPPYDKITQADVLDARGVDLDEEGSLYEHIASILKTIDEVDLSDDNDLKKKL